MAKRGPLLIVPINPTQEKTKNNKAKSGSDYKRKSNIVSTAQEQGIAQIRYAAQALREWPTQKDRDDNQQQDD